MRKSLGCNEQHQTRNTELRQLDDGTDSTLVGGPHLNFIGAARRPADLKLTVTLRAGSQLRVHINVSPSVRKNMYQPNDETSCALTDSLRATLCQIAKSARPTAMPIDTSKNR